MSSPRRRGITRGGIVRDDRFDHRQLEVVPDFLGRQRMVVDGKLIEPADEAAAVVGLERVRRPAADNQAAGNGRVVGSQRQGVDQRSVEVKLDRGAVLLSHEVMPAAGDVDLVGEDVAADPGVERPAVEEPERRGLEQRLAVPGRELQQKRVDEPAVMAELKVILGQDRARRARRS